MTKFYKHPMYGHVYGEGIPTPLARASWPSLVTPKAPPPPKPGQEPGQPRYELTLVLPQTREVKAWLDSVSVMAEEMLVDFNKGRKSKLTQETAAVESLAKDGNTFDHEKYPYYKDAFVLTARNAKLPPIIDAQGKDLAPNTIQGGMLIRAVVTPMITASGVSYKLNAVKLMKDDNIRFGGAVSNRSYLDMLSGDSPDEGEEEPAEEAENNEEVEEDTTEEETEETVNAPQEVKAKKAIKVKPSPKKAAGKEMALKML